ncbi:MAG: MFS transporter [Actinophytocola sp.]|uniref:MFS transporter n=1 Tax=Actinophytocola sp. TaxID=1872138 RepID=UPI003C7836E3
MSAERVLPSYWAVVLTASGVNFLAMLDSTVTMLAMPALAREFPTASLPDLSWVMSGYAVMFAALLAPCGRIADTLGRKRVFLGGIVLFTLASLLCALSPTLPMLVAARALQGAGAAVMVPASLAVLLMDTTAKRRVMSISLLSAAGGVAAAVGPGLGGLLVEAFSWHAVFLINIPVGIVAIVAGIRVLRPASATGGLPDVLGTILLALGVGGLTLGVTNGTTWEWTSVRTLACLAGGVVCLVLAVWRSVRHSSPAFEFSLFRGNRMFTAANVVALLYGTVMYAWLLGAVLFLTDIWRYTELEAGLAQTVGAVVAAGGAVGMGKIMGRFGGPRFASVVGMAAHAAVPALLLVFLTDESAFLTIWLPASVFVGFGIGATMMATMSAAAESAPATKFASVSALNNTARQIGGALGAAAVATILQAGTDAQGARTVSSYQSVFLCCLILTLIAIVVAAIGMTTSAAQRAAASSAAQRESAPVAD